MTAKPDLAAQIAELRRVLAEATKECPKSCTLVGSKHKRIGQNWDSGSLIEYDAGLCDGCQGSGRVARFPGFRQECQMCAAGIYMRDEVCPGWRVRAGGLEHGLSGLTEDQFYRWRMAWPRVMALNYPAKMMPPRDKILLIGLGLIIEIAEVPHDD